METIIIIKKTDNKPLESTISFEINNLDMFSLKQVHWPVLLLSCFVIQIKKQKTIIIQKKKINKINPTHLT